MALGGRKPCVPHPTPVVDEVRLSTYASSGEVGQPSSFVAQAYAAGKKVSGQTYTIFSNSDATKATAVVPGGAGTITRLAVGTTSLVVRVGTVSSLPLVVTVTAPVLARLTLTPAAVTLQSGQSTTLVYGAVNAYNVPMTNPAVTGEAENPLHANFGLIADGIAHVNALGSETTTGRVRVVAGSIVSPWTTVSVTAVVVPDPPGGGGGPPPEPEPSDLLTAIQSGDYDNGYLTVYDQPKPGSTATEFPGNMLAHTRIVPGLTNLQLQTFRTGVAAGARLSNENDSLRADFTVGLFGSGAGIEFSSLSLIVDHIITTVGNIATLGGLRTTVQSPQVFFNEPDDPTLGLPIIDITSSDSIQATIEALTQSTYIRLAAGNTWNERVRPLNPAGVDRIVLGRKPTTANTRFSKAAAATAGHPKIIGLANASTVALQSVEATLAHDFTLIGTQVTTPAVTAIFGGIVATNELVSAPSRLRELPKGFRSIQNTIFGHGALTSWNKAGLEISANGFESSYDWIQDIFYQNYPLDTGYDSQAIRLTWGSGRGKIKRPFLSGSHEHIAIGSTGTNINQFYIADVDIDGAHLYRPVTWKGVHASKNSTELKHGIRFRYSNCVMENAWRENQVGSAAVWWSALQSFWALCADIEMFRCLGIATSTLFEVTDKFAAGDDFGYVARRFRVHESASIGIANPAITGGLSTPYPHFWRVASQGGSLPYDIELDHCFGLVPNQDGNGASWGLANAGPLTRLRIKNNVGGVSGGFDPLFLNPAGNDAFGWANNSNTNGSNEWHHNFLQCLNPAAMINPAQNTYVSIGGLHLVNEASAHNPALAVANLGDLALAPGSPGIGTAEGGSNPGPDFAALSAALAGVRATADLPT